MKQTCCGTKTEEQHPDHSAETGKLNRVVGQIEGVKKMIAERRYCPDILTQLRAARAALKTIEANILESHLKGCVTEAMTNGQPADKNEKIQEIKELFKRFEDS